MTNTLMSIEDVAQYLNVSISTVRRWVKKGKLIGKKVGTQWRFDPLIVIEAYNNGMLSHSIESADKNFINHQPYNIPTWARPIITSWKNHNLKFIEKIHPDHVVVIDRRGSKIWELINDGKYTEGRNLWHSTIFNFISDKEASKLFNKKNVLLFDEMMQYGKIMHSIRRKLEHFNANVTSAVCIRRKSYAESGKLIEQNAIVYEDLDDKQFAERAGMISRLMNISSPPLDTDHILIKTKIKDEINLPTFLQNLSKHGTAYLVRYPDPDSDYNLCAITLDRPQFFNTDLNKAFNEFSFNWNNPCKIRFYINPKSNECSCTFIAFPEITAVEDTWQNLSITKGQLNPKNTTASKREIDIIFKKDSEKYNRIFSSIYLDLSLSLFRDFVLSGTMNEIGLLLYDTKKTINGDLTKAIYGDSTSKYILKYIKQIIFDYQSGSDIFSMTNSSPPNLYTRSNSEKLLYDDDLFECRQKLVNIIPKKTNDKNLSLISLHTLTNKLDNFSESTIGKAIDYEIDWGVIKPNTIHQLNTMGKEKMVIAKRGFSRGEFGPCFDFNDAITTHENILRRRTVVLGPIVMEKFLKGIDKSQLTASQFAKLFANLMHDWDLRNDKYDPLWLGWVPYLFGPLPVVPKQTIFGNYQRYENFLKDFNCIIETQEKHKTKFWNRYKPADQSKIQWKKIYNNITDATYRARVSGLVRAYSAIQLQTTTKRLSDTRSTKYSTFQDPLIVLGAARNEKLTYISGWFEITQWQEKGEFLFDKIEAMSFVEKRYNEPLLSKHLQDFSTPARLLFDKIQMYKNLPYLRNQLKQLADGSNLDYIDVILESTDPTPTIVSHSPYPIKNLEWASSIMRLFSSYVRQLMTSLNLETDSKSNLVKDTNIKRDANFYLKELLEVCEQLLPFEINLQNAISDSNVGVLTSKTAESLTIVFNTIVKLFKSEIPDPRPQFERDRDSMVSFDGLITRFTSIPYPEPYAIAELDINNIKNLIHLSEYLGGHSDKILYNILNKVKNDANNIVKQYPGVEIGGLSGDSIILVGTDVNKVISAVCKIISVTTYNLGIIDHRIIPFGLFRAGIAWYQSTLGDSFKGSQPGLTAHEIGSRHGGSKAGIICITHAIYDRLSEKNQAEFSDYNITSSQGKVYFLNWGPDKQFD